MRLWETRIGKAQFWGALFSLVPLWMSPGKDAASARYIYTRLERCVFLATTVLWHPPVFLRRISRLIFHPADDALLDFQASHVANMWARRLGAERVASNFLTAGHGLHRCKSAGGGRAANRAQVASSLRIPEGSLATFLAQVHPSDAHCPGERRRRCLELFSTDWIATNELR